MSGLAGALRVQAEKLIKHAHDTSQFEKPVAEGMLALGKAMDKLADMHDLIARFGRVDDDDLTDIDAFFAAVEERIEQRAKERALASRTDNAACPACGAALRPVGAA